MAQYKFRAKLWEYDGKGAWIFVTVPKSLSKKIRNAHGAAEEGWGRLKTAAQIGKTKWNSAIWFDSKVQSYLLPIKVSVRKAEGLNIGDPAGVMLFFAAEKKAKRTPQFFSN